MVVDPLPDVLVLILDSRTHRKVCVLRFPPVNSEEKQFKAMESNHRQPHFAMGLGIWPSDFWAARLPVCARDENRIPIAWKQGWRLVEVEKQAMVGPQTPDQGCSRGAWPKVNQWHKHQRQNPKHNYYVYGPERTVKGHNPHSQQPTSTEPWVSDRAQHATYRHYQGGRAEAEEFWVAPNMSKTLQHFPVWTLLGSSLARSLARTTERTIGAKGLSGVDVFSIAHSQWSKPVPSAPNLGWVDERINLSIPAPTWVKTIENSTHIHDF
jgi:hypothetical protein